MARHYAIWLPLLLFAFSSNAAKTSPDPSFNKIVFKNAYFIDPTSSGEFATLVIPIKRAFNLIVVEAKIDTTEGNFVLDTGAPYLVLNQTYFRDAVKNMDQESAAGINGGTVGSFQTIVRSFDIAELHFNHLQADVTDLSGIENSRGIKVLGLLGAGLFSKYAITVDLFQNLLFIHKLDSNGEIPEAERQYHNQIIKMPFKYINNAIFLKGYLDNNSFWFAFDTGAETNLIDYHQSKKLAASMEVLRRSKLTGIGGSSYEVIYARFDKMFIGERTFVNNRFLVTSLDAMGKAYGQSVDGILGADFFARGIFTLNFVKKEFVMFEYKAN